MAPRRRRPIGIVLGLALLTACGGSGADGDVTAAERAPVPTLYWLDVYANAVHRSTGPDYEDAEVVVEGTDQGPDGIGVDVEGGRLYWTSMGDPFGGTGELGGEHPPPGTLQRADLDGTDVERIVEPGLTRTPKQLALDVEHDHVYWADREGATLWRAGLDGSDPTPLVRGHGLRELVGVALDVAGGRLYFSDRTGRHVWRAGLDLPAGQTADDRTDLEMVVEATGTSMPVDVAIDHDAGQLYWTDRLAGTLQRAGLELPEGQTARTRTDVETVLDGLEEPIGIALDAPNDHLYVTELGRGVSEATLDGEELRRVGRATGTTGVVLVHLPPPDAG